MFVNSRLIHTGNTYLSSARIDPYKKMRTYFIFQSLTPGPSLPGFKYNIDYYELFLNTFHAPYVCGCVLRTASGYLRLSREENLSRKFTFSNTYQGKYFKSLTYQIKMNKQPTYIIISIESWKIIIL